MGNGNSQIPATSSSSTTISASNAFTGQCLSGVASACSGYSVDVSDEGFRTFMSQAVSVALFINTTMNLTITSSFTVLIAKAYSAYMCVFNTT